MVNPGCRNCLSLEDESVLIFPSNKCAAISFTDHFFAIVGNCHSSCDKDRNSSMSLLSSVGKRCVVGIGTFSSNQVEIGVMNYKLMNKTRYFPTHHL